jgi:predicted RNA-binding protein with TRAM domain
MGGRADGGTSLTIPTQVDMEVYTMEISDELLCLFSERVRSKDGTYVIEVPQREIETGSVDADETYRVALISRDHEGGGAEAETADSGSPSSEPQPPVEIGEIRYVEVEDIGKQGDGIARVERGYVIIVPGAEIGERVKIEVTEVKSNFAVGEIIEEDF